MELKLSSPQDCIGDFTYDFFWQHRGAKLNPADMIPSQLGTSHSYEDVVEALKKGEDVHIKGDAGKRLGSSLGVDLVFFGGSGNELPEVGSVIVDGNAGAYLGMGMLSGAVYVKSKVEEPLGNVVQVKSDLEGYKKFVSITWLLHHPEEKEMKSILEPNVFKEGELFLADRILRSTLAARCMKEAKVHVIGAKMTGGRIICRRTKPVPPVEEKRLEKEDLVLLAEFGISGMLTMNYGRYEV